MPFVIRAETCKDCGSCKDVCPAKAIKRNNKKKAYEIDPAKCTDCVGVLKGPKCVKVCASDSCVPLATESSAPVATESCVPVTGSSASEPTGSTGGDTKKEGERSAAPTPRHSTADEHLRDKAPVRADSSQPHPTPLLDQLESGPWPSFVTGLKRLRDSQDKQYAPMMDDLLGQLEHSYTERLGFWKGGDVGINGYGGGVIPRCSEVADKFPALKEFHTLPIMAPAGYHYSTDILRKMCDVWEQYGSGLITLHGQSGDILFQGSTTENAQKAFDALNELGFDFGGSGPAVRSSMSCVGHARCEKSCYDEVRTHRMIIDRFINELHRPGMPHKFEFKFSGCPNDCTNAIHRADMAVIGIWRDHMKVDQEEVKAYVAKAGRKYTIDHVIAMCPSRALSLNDDDTLDVDNKSCVRCMHCINVMTKALSPGDDRGVSILMGGKDTAKVGDMMGVMVVPFMRLESDEDFAKLGEFAGKVLKFFTENALEHEPMGDMIDRIGLPVFLEGIGVDPDPNMVSHPRTSSYVRTDDFAVEADKYFARKSKQAVLPGAAE